LLELYRPKNSVIHRIPARLKIVFILFFIVMLNLVPINAWMGFALFSILIATIVILSKVEPLFILKRSLLALPFILSALPLIFYGPEPLSQIHLFDHFFLSISPIGVGQCISIMFKAWLSIQAAILLTATTSFSDLISGFRQLRLPAILISIIEMMWRYLFVMVDEVTRLIRARNSRSSAVDHRHHSGGSVFWRARTTGNMAGSLFLRSIERSERVYAAMVSRGYTGEPLDDPVARFTITDGVIIFFGMSIITAIYLFSFYSGR
jgi:cobalt/nickel transport system permease protein